MHGAQICYKQLGLLMRGARERAGYSREQAVMLLGLPNVNFLCNAENAKATFPAKKLSRAAEVYGLSLGAIIEAIVQDDVEGLQKFLKVKK